MRFLTLTSPFTHGEDVRLAQLQLAGKNVFGVNFHPGIPDGQFGEQTGAACVRAKTYLGYASDQIAPSYGEELRDYLSGQRLPLIKKVRQHRTPQTLNLRALAEARKHIGEKEQPPNSNHIRYSVWYGIDGQPWCAAFVSWCYVQVGSKTFAPRQHYAYVPFIVNDARAGRNGLSVVQQPHPGDLVCYDWDGGVADHVGLFDHWASPTHDAFVAVEGNTAVGNDSNGGQVMLRNRRLSQVEAFVRVAK